MNFSDSLMRFLVVLAILLVAMFAGGSIGSFLMELFGAPGALIAWKYTGSMTSKVRWAVGGFVCVIGQCLVALPFVWWCAGMVRVNAPESWFARAPLYVVAFFAGIAPTRTSARKSRRAIREEPELERESVVHTALFFNCVLVIVTYFVTVFWRL